MPRISDTTRAAILADIEAGTKSRNQIARDHDVSVGSVTNIARGAELTDAFDRSKTENATRAAAIDSKALRVATARRFLDKANDLLTQMDQPHVVFNIGGKDNIYTEQLMPKPPTGDLRNLMVAAATAIDKHLVLERHDAGDPGTMGSLLGSLLDGLQQKHGTGDA